MRIYGARPAVIGFAVALAGCASLGTSPQQEYTLASFHQCENVGTKQIILDRVTSDGRYWYRYWGAYDQRIFLECMAQYRRDHPFPDWLRAKGVSVASGVAPAAVGGATAVGGSSAVQLPVEAPTWKVGDEWRYAYKSPSDSGSYVWLVDRVETMDGVPHYVIKTGTREIFYRVSDFASTIERVDGVVVTRFTPPRMNFGWPLAAEKVWEQAYREERPVDRSTTDRDAVWKIDGEETVTVLAGTFRTYKISFRNRNTGALFYEMWVAPEVKQWVKIREYLASGVRERELTSFKFAKP
jgi:hypothetical protein